MKFAESLSGTQLKTARIIENSGCTTYSQAVKKIERGEAGKITKLANLLVANNSRFEYANGSWRITGNLNTSARPAQTIEIAYTEAFGYMQGIE